MNTLKGLGNCSHEEGLDRVIATRTMDLALEGRSRFPSYFLTSINIERPPLMVFIFSDPVILCHFPVYFCALEMPIAIYTLY